MLMQRRGATAVSSIIALLASAASGCGTAPDTSPSGAEAARAPVVVRVTTVKPERTTLRRVTSQPGHIEAYEIASIRAKLAGYIEKVAVDIGDPVVKGQVLAELSVPETVAELEQKRALVEQAEADRKQAEAAVRVAESAVKSAEAIVSATRAGIRRAEADVARWEAEFGRTSQLARESAITGSLLDETRSKLEAAQAARDEIGARVASAEAARDQALAERDKSRSDVVSAAARVDVAKATARQAEAMVAYATIVAPFDGVVTRRDYDPGHLTAPGTNAEPLFVIARSDVVTISVGVPEADAPYVNPGDPARVRLQAMGGRVFEGTVTRAAWALDASTRTLRVEIDLPNEGDALRPGLYAYATIIAEEHKDALSVPASAVVTEGDATYCVAVEGGRAARKPVKVGLTEGKLAEILSGLDGTEAIVEANAGSLADGQPVEATPAPAPKS